MPLNRRDLAPDKPLVPKTDTRLALAGGNPSGNSGTRSFF